MSSDYVLTVGLEIHAELRTQTKMFCDSKNDPDETRPNANVCPVCMGHPGTLPVMNKEAVRHVLKVGIALGGARADFTEFDRKNYFYPDIPKGYQLSQYEFPLVVGGSLNGVAITRVHLEEDTATSLHEEGSYSLVDFNRAGVPLMELVTEPVIHSAKEAGDFARELQLLLRYLGASAANMEKGEMRVEANISVSRQTEIADERRLNADSRGSGETQTDSDKKGKLLYEELSYKIRGAVFAVKNVLGSGHKESVYHNALEQEFKKIELHYEKEKVVDVLYIGEKVGVYRPDFVLEEKILLELKALPFIGKKEKEQLWHYLKGSQYRLAFVVNFGSQELQIERVVYDSIRDNPRSHPRQSAPLGTKVEVKNLNSFRAVERAILYERERHIGLLERGEQIVQETRGWDENTGRTFPQRRKEETHDYRYFPDPDLSKLLIGEIPGFAYAELLREIPELPEVKRGRYRGFGIRNEDSETLVANRALSSLFEEASVSLGKEERLLAASYITSDLMGLLKKANVDGDAVKFCFSPKDFAELIRMTAEKKLSSRGAKDILQVLFEKGGSPETIATTRGLLQKNDAEELETIVKSIVAANEKVAADYRAGKAAALQFLVGQAMKATKGAANPQILRTLFTEWLR